MPTEREVAHEPEDLRQLLVERVNSGDVDGLVALYQPHAVLAVGGGRTARGTEAIRAVYQQLVADRPTFPPGQQFADPAFARPGAHLHPARRRIRHRRGGLPTG